MSTLLLCSTHAPLARLLLTRPSELVSLQQIKLVLFCFCGLNGYTATITVIIGQQEGDYD